MAAPVRLEVEDLAWGPPGRPPVLSGVSFALAPGARLAVVGPNGAGKSTLLRCLYRVNRPTAGRLRLDGDDLWALPARQAARRVAAVLQETPPDFAFTVREMVEAGRTPHAGAFGDPGGAAVVEDAMARMEISAFAARRFATLSGGEKQRALIARALAQQPGLLVLDEPTNHLDIRHRLEAIELLKGLDLTIVATLHDLDFAADMADHVLALEGGRPVAFGPARETLAPALIRRSFGVEAEVTPWRGTLRFAYRLPEEGA
ncbi:ABC transporter ATP-binding protein [Methylopila jiangsuensis]|uniref:ABC transporter ATP-binding protein n=1 Tax=Methylopila jiangsuensis TaxID=586230 RepID=A0A9W6JGQ4_9HYPH|nr:ABC transporter ATP-binding protein [Methylopila jiangsuensis]MDR6286368.1 iron complex transport system ATP-binding protein [Methylopila jiangsuensis]GLK77295.1 ABC transporter ATP-binding protein [Methylopila jiangsuensis]